MTTERKNKNMNTNRDRDRDSRVVWKPALPLKRGNQAIGNPMQEE
jgi:hypothetical protein